MHFQMAGTWMVLHPVLFAHMLMAFPLWKWVSSLFHLHCAIHTWSLSRVLTETGPSEWAHPVKGHCYQRNSPHSGTSFDGLHFTVRINYGFNQRTSACSMLSILEHTEEKILCITEKTGVNTPRTKAEVQRSTWRSSELDRSPSRTSGTDSKCLREVGLLPASSHLSASSHWQEAERRCMSQVRCLCKVTE